LLRSDRLLLLLMLLVVKVAIVRAVLLLPHYSS